MPQPMTNPKLSDLINPNDSPERQIAKLLRICDSLMRRVEQGTQQSGAAYEQFQRAAILEAEVQNRTRELERALDLLNHSNAALAKANHETEAARADLANAIETVQEGFALFDPKEVLVMCNSRFGLHMPDIHHNLKPGLSFASYVDLVSQSTYIDLPSDATPQEWAARRLRQHKDDHVIFNVRMVRDHWVQVSEHRTPDGGTVILQTDVTDIMRLERQERDRLLDDQSRIIQATLEHLDQGVCNFDSQGRLQGWNQRAGDLMSIPVTNFRTGYRFQTVFQNLASKKVTLSDGLSLRDILDWVDLKRYRPQLNFEMCTSGGQVLSIRMREMPDQGFVASFSDVTTERNAVQAIRQANELLEQRVQERTLELADALTEAERANASKTRFVAAASHDLLQPLSAAKLYLASLSGGEPTAVPTQEIADKALRALGSVENILEALLDISNLDSGMAALHPGVLALGGILDRLQNEFSPIARAKGLELKIVTSGVTVVSDGSYLRRVLQNLIANAVRYTEKGRVLVGVRRRGKTVQVQIWDTGPGIAREQQDVIFGEFQRLDSAASAAEGMGLGLAIVERACALLNHPLDLCSEVGKGTMFSVTLPVSDRALFVPSGSGELRVGSSERIDDLIVLLIENDPELRQALTLALEQRNIAVLPAATRSDVLDLIHGEGLEPDAIIADYQLADDQFGTDIVAEVQEKLGQVSACIISADHGLRLREICEGADLPLFHKPVGLETLEAFLQQVAEMRK